MTEHNPAAFPIKQPMTNDFLGMSLLDYFAGLAMPHVYGRVEFERVAELSYELAETMLKERYKRGTNGSNDYSFTRTAGTGVECA